MLQNHRPEDYVVASGETHEVREFAHLSFARAGINIEWCGEGIEEEALDSATGRVLVKVDPAFFRPAEVDVLIGDSSKIRSELGWKPEVGFRELVNMMVDADLERHHV
jgi:GDPmannose 4,6-dehydratase